MFFSSPKMEKVKIFFGRKTHTRVFDFVWVKWKSVSEAWMVRMVWSSKKLSPGIRNFFQSPAAAAGRHQSVPKKITTHRYHSSSSNCEASTVSVGPRHTDGTTSFTLSLSHSLSLFHRLILYLGVSILTPQMYASWDHLYSFLYVL